LIHAALCEVAIKVKEKFPNHIINLVFAPFIKYYYDDWVLWSTEQTMKSVDIQVEQIQQQWKEEDHSQDPVIIEYEPDGSEAQELLGGMMEIKAPWAE
jgi:hypothetical protein